MAERQQRSAVSLFIKQYLQYFYLSSDILPKFAKLYLCKLSVKFDIY